MGLLNGMFGKNNEQVGSKLNWNTLESIDDLDVAEQRSFLKTIVLFKHSTRCSVSRFVLKQFESIYSIPEEQMDIYFLDLIAFRAVSNEIASRYNVTHQSPQLIVLKEGKAIYDVSHESIDANVLKQYI